MEFLTHILIDFSLQLLGKATQFCKLLGSKRMSDVPLLSARCTTATPMFTNLANISTLEPPGSKMKMPR